MPSAKVAALPLAGTADTAGTEVEKPATGTNETHLNAKAILEQVTAATAVAAQITAASTLQTPEANAGGTGESERREIAAVNGLVALLIVRPGITSVAELSGKTIAVNDPKSAAGRQVSAAIEAAGATRVQLSDASTKAIDQLIGGTVPAAVLGLVSAAAAESFPDIAGFNVLQVPLSPSAMKAGTDTP